MSDAHDIEVRHERPGDEPAITRVNDAAFGQSDESRIITAVRAAGHSVLSLVAVRGDAVIGHIMFTPVSIEPHGAAIHALGLGPMAVMPALQRQGIGSSLVTAGLRECARVGCQAVVVIGHPEFYPRFGFRPGNSYGLRSPFEVPDEVFMAAELSAGALAGRGGLVRYVAEFG